MPVSLNSLIAYYDNIHKFQRREKEILGHLVMNPTPHTVRQLKEALRYVDINSVAPRVSKLIDLDVLEVVDKVKCSTTGESVRRVFIKQPATGQMQFELERKIV